MKIKSHLHPVQLFFKEFEKIKFYSFFPLKIKKIPNQTRTKQRLIEVS